MAAQVEAVALQTLIQGSPTAQVEAFGAQALVVGSPVIRVEALAQQALVTVLPGAVDSTLTATSILSAAGAITAIGGVAALTASSSLSASATVTAPVPDPSVISGKVLWLRAGDQTGANASAVTSLIDQSGKSNNPTSVTGTTTKTGATPSGGRSLVVNGGAIMLSELFLAQRISATASSAILPADAATDGNAGSTWNSSNTGTAWLRLEPATPTVVTSVSLQTTAGYVTLKAPRDFLIQGSQDGSAWTTLDTRSGVSGWVADVPQTFTFTNTTAYRYYRVYVTAAVGSSEVAISEVKLNGATNTITPGDGELWVVAKSTDTTNGNAWKFGGGSQGSFYPWQDGTVYTEFGNSTRRVYSPTVSLVNQWRIFHLTMTAGGVLVERIDNAQQVSLTGITPSWAPVGTMALSQSWHGEIAEVLVRNSVATAGERATLVTYFNAQHGLTVAVPLTQPLTATSTLTATATVTAGGITGAASLTASSTLTATGSTSSTGTATLAASSSLTAAATVQTVALGVAPLVASSSLTSAATVLQGPGWITGKVLWLRSANLPLGPVTTWPDKSGTNTVVTGSGGTTVDSYAFNRGGNLGPYARTLLPTGSGAFPVYGASSWAMSATSNGELWMVVQGFNTGAWTYGTSGFTNGYVPGGSSGNTTYDDTGSSTQHAVTPAVQVAGVWRVYRVVVSGNTWTASHDNIQSGRYTGSTRRWASAPKVLDRFDGQVADILVFNRTLTAAEAASVYQYYNGVYNLNVQTGATLPATATLTSRSTLTASAFVGVTTTSAAATLTAKSTLTATIAPVRLAAAALSSTSVLKATAQATVLQAIAELSATSILEGTPVPPAQWEGEVTLYAAAALFADADSGATAEAALEATSVLEAAGTAYTPYVQPNDPRTGRPQYRLIVAHRDGERLAELTNATVSAIESGVGVGASFNFEAPTSDPKMAYAKAPGRQAQVWRGTDLEFRGPIVTLDDDQEGGVTTVKCRDPFWYLESGRRVIGAIPKRDLLVNGSFQTGEEPPWRGAYAPDSVPLAQPVRDVIDVDFFGTQMKALQISGVDKVVTVTKEVKTAAVFVPNSASYLPGGESAIQAVAALMPKTGSLSVDVKGYTADNRINGDYGDGMELSKARADAAAATIRAVRPNATTTTHGYGYYYQVPGGLDANRRVVVSWSGVQEASGHRQYEVQSLRITQPVAKKAPLPLTFVGWTKITKWLGPSKDGWGVYIQVANPAKPKDKPIDSAHADIDEKTPRNRWLRMEATVEVPADGIEYEVQVRFYPPAGTALWTRGGLYPGDQLGYFDVDQALIIKALVEHAQDASMGKGDLGIGTRCQPTGIVRTREYPYHERMPIDTAINEIATLFRGPEVVMEVTPTAQTVVTYHPRQGQRTSQVLVQGGNVVAYEAPTDNREAASSIILQSDGGGADREEGYASDRRALDGLMLERVISTEGDTPVTELEEGAVKALNRLKNPQPAVWVTIDPARTGEVRDALGQGDYLRAIIPDADIDGTYRYVKRRLHPGSDLLELMLTPEED